MEFCQISYLAPLGEYSVQSFRGAFQLFTELKKELTNSYKERRRHRRKTMLINTREKMKKTSPLVFDLVGHSKGGATAVLAGVMLQGMMGAICKKLSVVV